MANVLDEIFEANEENVETFSDLVSSTASKSITDNEVAKIRNTAKFSSQTQKFITIEHGRHESHYVWHVSPVSEKRGWPGNLKLVVYSIAKVLKKYIPDDVIVDIHLPNERYGIDVLTIRANNLMDNWAMNDDVIATATGQLFEVINSL